MKNLKVLYVTVLAIVLSEKADAQKTILSNKEVPITISNYINHHFKDHKIKKIIKEVNDNKTDYEIRLNRKVELEFDEAYQIMEIDSKHGVSKNLLPTSIVEYVQVHYPDLKIIEWKLIKHGQKIELSNSSEIQFDPNGKFIK